MTIATKQFPGWLDDLIGGTKFKRASAELVKRPRVRIEGVDETRFYDDPTAGELVLDLSALPTAGIAYDLVPHPGGGQEVVSLTGALGVVNVRGTAAMTFGAAPAHLGESLRFSKPTTTWTVARRNFNGDDDVMVWGGLSDATHEELFFGSLSTGTPNTRFKISTALFQLRTGPTSVNNPAVEVNASAFTLGPTGASGMPLAFGTTPATGGSAGGVAAPSLLRVPSATTIAGSYSVIAARDDAAADNRNVLGLYTNGSGHMGIFIGDSALGSTEIVLGQTSLKLKAGTLALGDYTVAVNPNALQFSPLAAYPVISQLAATSDVDTFGLGVLAQDAYASSTGTHRFGGVLSLRSGRGLGDDPKLTGYAELGVGGQSYGSTLRIYAQPAVAGDGPELSLGAIDYTTWTSRDNKVSISDQLYSATTSATTADQTIATIPLWMATSELGVNDVFVDIWAVVSPDTNTVVGGRATVQQLCAEDGTNHVSLIAANGVSSGASGSAFTPKVTVSGNTSSGGTLTVKVTPWTATSTKWGVAVQRKRRRS